eukprot:GHVU01155882.1.p1 GENE.GHVU01155882.1~~GHVU01155882.1.p1  ORF type:complete len:136 (+),score=4.72 GHVU01155882.1:196-603(+)
MPVLEQLADATANSRSCRATSARDGARPPPPSFVTATICRTCMRTHAHARTRTCTHTRTRTHTHAHGRTHTRMCGHAMINLFVVADSIKSFSRHPILDGLPSRDRDAATVAHAVARLLVQPRQVGYKYVCRWRGK